MNWDNNTRLAVALLFVIGYLLMCGGIWWTRHRARKQRALLAAGDRQSWLIAYASQTGFAEQLAQRTVEILKTAGIKTRLAVLSDIDASDLEQTERALFVVSTYGEGAPPDNGVAFASKVVSSGQATLNQLHFGMLMLGDSSYSQFCGFGRDLTTWLKARGAQPLFDNVTVNSNGDTKKSLQAWQHELSHIAGTNDAPDWEGPTYQQWILTARRELNPGSAGNPAFHIELQPPHDVVADWQAGDLIQVLAPSDLHKPRDYSIASIPSDGSLHLLVRQEKHSDGTLGIASGWLTHTASVGAIVDMRLRTHANFRIGENRDRPLILIGNGTGLAGLRSHLKARAASGKATRNWLIFGERQAEYDFFHKEDILRWQDSNVLEQADIVFSRDGERREYVQDRLLSKASEVRRWIEDGAAIYICGSLQGMASGLNDALTEILGEETLARLTMEGRYRRDVY
ncbi:sulfite reductase subunit alpha [Oxalicibacterium faecigallinarum]|uniref:NADPH--hemoprotein reductase n=1 Tax=Oxalicibacterium faecigallinarum TaxID=573741 RepID=A0A8J3F307_9BURK|nr:sulfite reductase subunit alpha [Oxalicibacterium faecigallinarum]GGI19296.1 oxidoreductase [Oxalicibacterium faecigallinarum]